MKSFIHRDFFDFEVLSYPVLIVIARESMDQMNHPHHKSVYTSNPGLLTYTSDFHATRYAVIPKWLLYHYAVRGSGTLHILLNDELFLFI